MYKIRLNDGQEFGPGEMDLILQWGREGRVPADALLVDEADGSARPVLEEPMLARIINAPPTAVSGVSQPVDQTEGPAMIPTRNPNALIGYYLSILGLLPLVGLFAAVPAVVLGVMGLRKVRRDPKIRGTAHAIIAIVLGSIGVLGNGFCLTMMIVSSFGP